MVDHPEPGCLIPRRFKQAGDVGRSLRRRRDSLIVKYYCVSCQGAKFWSNVVFAFVGPMGDRLFL